jgi:hypothetical protein
MNSMVRSDNLRKRNLYLALAVSLLAMTFLFYADEGGMTWMMWRDSPWVAVALVFGSLICWRLWWRTPRD